jgi:metallo-beta-lactamase family protein
MHIQFHGAAQTVTGSQFLLQVNGKKLLVDCGLYQGRREESYRRNLNFAYDPAQVDAAILSHAHIDHCGNFPNLVKNGFAGPIYATGASADLADIMLRDSGHIQESDADFINKHLDRRGGKRVEPLYTSQDAARVSTLLHRVEYNTPFNPVAGVTARLLDAGHILGSAAVVLDIEEDGQRSRLWFSGDIGRRNLPLLRDPILPQAADYLVMECTYGDTIHPHPDGAYKEFCEVLVRTVKRGGKVIVPAFAVGRTQELVYFLNQAITEGSVPPIPVFVDSPLAVEASKIFQAHPEVYDEETREFVRKGRHPALNFKQLTYVSDVEQSKRINSLKGPLVIISASGMAETGRILHHLKNNIEDSRNTVMIVSYQAPDTLGRRLVEGQKRVHIFGEEYVVRAEVVDIEGLSAHAGQDMLLRYAQTSGDRLKQIMLVHGEPKPAEVFRGLLSRSGFKRVLYPTLHQSVEL